MASSVNIPDFWYRRVCKISLALSAAVIAIWAGEILLPSSMPAVAFDLSWPAIAGFGLTLIVSLTAVIFSRRINAFYGAQASYLALAAALLLATLPGPAGSLAFWVVWSAVAVFAGFFGSWNLLAISAVASAYIGYLLATVSQPTGRTALLIWVTLAPLVISFLVWRRRKTPHDEKEQAYSALARQLSQIANKSDIVINAIADGVVAIDHKGIVQLINPAGQTMIGWSANDAIGLDYRSVLKIVNERGESLDDEQDIIQQVLKTNITTSSNDFAIMTSTGKKFLASLSVSPVGSLGSGAIVVFRDITQETAEGRQQAEFISTASHEMRTPVAAIEGYLGLALNPQTANIDDKARAYLTKAHESAQHLGRLFQDLLDVSRADDSRLNNNPQVIDVVAFVREVVTSLAPQAASKQLAMIYKPDIEQVRSQRISPMFYIVADVDHLREVLNNLIENAIKYTRQGDVTADVTGDDETVTITITDTGIGIPPEDIPHLFQKFYRVDSTATREIGGTGLGLYLSRRLTEAMGGHIEVKSQYGQGSQFTLKFNRLSNKEAAERIEDNAGKPQT